jgi:hypothetical protein
MKLLEEEKVFIRAFDPNFNNHTDPSDSMTKAMRGSTNTFSDFSKYLRFNFFDSLQKNINFYMIAFRRIRDSPSTSFRLDFVMGTLAFFPLLGRTQDLPTLGTDKVL